MCGQKVREREGGGERDMQSVLGLVTCAETTEAGMPGEK